MGSAFAPQNSTAFPKFVPLKSLCAGKFIAQKRRNADKLRNCRPAHDLSSRGGLQMFSIYRLFKPVGAVRFLVGVAAMLVLAAPALAQTFAVGDGFCTYTQGGWGAVPQ